MDKDTQAIVAVVWDWVVFNAIGLMLGLVLTLLGGHDVTEAIVFLLGPLQPAILLFVLITNLAGRAARWAGHVAYFLGAGGAVAWIYIAALGAPPKERMAAVIFMFFLGVMAVLLYVGFLIVRFFMRPAEARRRKSKW
jgi:hypothetical protein